MTLSFRPAAVAAVLIVAIGCQATTSPSIRPSASEPLAATSVPSTLASPPPSPSATLALTGTIAFTRGEYPDPEHNVTIRPDGSDEHDLFSIAGCHCLQLSPDGTTVWTQTETAWGTVAFTTMRPDGTGKKVQVPPTKTLSLVTGPDASTPDGRLIAFYGWDDTRPKAAGVYLAAPDLSDLRRVTGLPDGFEWITPYGLTADGARVLFFAERGAIGGIRHTGDLYVVDATGRNLRKLNADGWYVAETGGRLTSLSSNGKRATFTACNVATKAGAIFVAPLDGGRAQPVVELTYCSSSAVWAPIGEMIEFGPREDGVHFIVNADGSRRREIAPDEVGSVAWSPDSKYLAVARGPEGSRDLWITDLEGTYLTQVTHQPGTYTVYDWR